MEVYHPFRLSIRTILLSSLKQEMVKNNFEVYETPNLKRSEKGYLDILFCLGGKKKILNY